jgi:tRNA A37 threonylcarbamoyladenosine dehydratase
MHEHWLERTELLLGKEQVAKLAKKNVLVVGLGGVGAYAAEMIVRAGIGKMTIVDGDVVNVTNLNRQLPAVLSNMGKSKAGLMGQRLKDINPKLELTVVDRFIRDEFMIELLREDFDYVVDAIDTLSPKIYLIYHCMQRGLKLVSSMGAGGKMDPTKVHLADLSQSYNCKLARIIRKRLRKLNIHGGFPVVYSSEPVAEDAVVETEGEQNKKSMVGTISYLPPLFGIYCASQVIRDLMAES